MIFIGIFYYNSHIFSVKLKLLFPFKTPQKNPPFFRGGFLFKVKQTTLQHLIQYLVPCQCQWKFPHQIHVSAGK